MEWHWQRKSEELEEKPDPLPLCPTQIPHGLTWARTRASMVRGWRLAAKTYRCNKPTSQITDWTDNSTNFPVPHTTLRNKICLCLRSKKYECNIPVISTGLREYWEIKFRIPAAVQEMEASLLHQKFRKRLYLFLEFRRCFVVLWRSAHKYFFFPLASNSSKQQNKDPQIFITNRLCICKALNSLTIALSQENSSKYALHLLDVKQLYNLSYFPSLEWRYVCLYAYYRIESSIKSSRYTIHSFGDPNPFKRCRIYYYYYYCS
jgi:hypothetical protein